MENVWQGATTGLGAIMSAPKSLIADLNVIIIGGVIVVGAVLIMIAYSFASGRQNAAAIVQAGTGYVRPF